MTHLKTEPKSPKRRKRKEVRELKKRIKEKTKKRTKNSPEIWTEEPNWDLNNGKKKNVNKGKRKKKQIILKEKR